jgi:hypothetical protein
LQLCLPPLWFPLLLIITSCAFVAWLAWLPVLRRLLLALLPWQGSKTELLVQTSLA